MMHNLHKAMMHMYEGRVKSSTPTPAHSLDQMCYWSLTKKAQLEGGTAGIDNGHILTLTIMKRKKTRFSAKAALLLVQVKDPAHVLILMCRGTKVASRFNHSPKDDKGITQLLPCHPVLTALVLKSWVSFCCCESNGFHPAPDSWSLGVLKLYGLKSSSRLKFMTKARNRNVAVLWRVKSQLATKEIQNIGSDFTQLLSKSLLSSI